MCLCAFAGGVGDPLSDSSITLTGCVTALYLFSKVDPSLLVNHATTIQPYLSIKCTVSGPVLCTSICACVRACVYVDTYYVFQLLVSSSLLCTYVCTYVHKHMFTLTGVVSTHKLQMSVFFPVYFRVKMMSWLLCT